MTKLVYLSWVREMIGHSEEEVELPDNVTTVGDLVHFLRDHGETHRAVMEHESVIRFAVDHEAAELGDSIVGAKEIAVFPPMTGG